MADIRSFLRHAMFFMNRPRLHSARRGVKVSASLRLSGVNESARARQ